MKHLLLAILITFSSFFAPHSNNAHLKIAKVVPLEKVVYITRTGAKYHLGTCRYLRQSKIKTTKKEAINNGYSACKVCQP
jgi:hypothetical protein